MNPFGSVPQQTRTDEALSQREGPVARTIERQTAKLPSDLFLWAAGAAVIASLALEIAGMRRGGVRSRFAKSANGSRASAPLAGFVGMWVPSLLLLGVYNKIVKVGGSDRFRA